MARKAKVVAPVFSEDQFIAVLQANPEGGQVVVEAGSVEAQEIHAEVVEQEEEVVEQSTGPSLLSATLAQIEQEEVKEVVAKPKVEKNDGVGIFIKNLINDGLSNKDILKIVHEQYGNKNTTYACVAWYRNKMKKSGAVQAKSSALDFINNFAKSNGLSEEAVETLKQGLKVA